MWATDLIGCDVYDAAGARLGRVHDLSFAMSGGDGTPVRLRLTGLSCRDTVAVGHRLGYGTCDMAGPWPLDAIFRRSGRRATVRLDWTDVATIERRRITLRRHRTDLTTRSEPRDRQ
jgi:sporulation protein YlmC with PRC-barrel domain